MTAGRDDVPVASVYCGDASVQIRTLWSGVSRGTERLVFEGRVPAGEYQRMRAPLQDGDFPFPVKYGYCAVGVVEAGVAHLVGKRVFCLHPHQDRFVVPALSVAVLPDALPPRRAVLTANMETALNAVWDGAPMPGDTIVIVGAGALGLLITSIVARLPGVDVRVVDVNMERRGAIEVVGGRFVSPDMLGEAEADVVFHTSATAAGLSTSLNAAGFEGRIVEASWYGDSAVPVPLGGAFHSKRLSLISSQVGTVSASRRMRWPYARRLSMVLSLLGDVRLDALITDEVRFDDLADAMPRIFDAPPTSIVTAVRYFDGDNDG